MFESDVDSADLLSSDDVEFLDTSDTNDESCVDLDDGFYHADHMSAEEVERIDDIWNDTPDFSSNVEPYKASSNAELLAESDIVEPYHATRIADTKEFAGDLADAGEVEDTFSAKSLEEQFASDVDAMSFDDLRAEQDRLDQLSQMDDLDIFAAYDMEQRGKYDPELFSTLTDGLPRETLEQLKEGLANGNPDVYDYFGLNGGEAGDTAEEISRTRKR